MKTVRCVVDILTVFMAATSGVWAQSSAPIFPSAVSPQNIGTEFEVEVKVGNSTNPVSNLFGLSFELNYTNADLVDVVGSPTAGDFLGNDIIFFSVVEDANSKVAIGMSRKAGQGGVTGSSGAVLKVKFKTLATTPNGTQVQFTITNVTANDPNGSPITLRSIPLLVVIGTDVQNFWQQTNGSFRETIQVLAINSNEHIFAGTANGIFRTTNNGSSWTKVNTGLTDTVIWSLAINSRGHIFAGTGVAGVFRSTNNGDSWTPVDSGLGNISVLALALNDNGHIFAGTGGAGIFRSTNNGDSWTPVNTGLGNISVLALAINDSGHIFAGTLTLDGVFRSTNNGDSWTRVNTGLPNALIRSLVINVSGYIFTGTDGNGVFRSTNNGDSWARVNTGLSNINVYKLVINSSEYIFAGTDVNGVFRSTNNGYSWTPVNTGLGNISVRALAINSSGHIFAGTEDNGVFRSSQSTLLPIAPVVDTTAATNVGLTSATLNSIVSPNGFSTIVKFQYGTTKNYGGEFLLQGSVKGNSEVSVRAELEHLFPNTIYHFRVVATNSAGATEGEDQTFKTLSCGPLTLDHIPALFQNADSNITIVANIFSACGVDSVLLKYRQGGDANFTTAAVSRSDNSYEWTIPASVVTSRGVEYFIAATDSFRTVTAKAPSDGVFSVQVNVRAGVKNDHAQVAGNEQNAYRLVSMPLDLDNKSAKVVLEDNMKLGPYNKKKWRCFALNTKRQKYVEFPEFADIIKVTSGQAFLLIVKESKKFIDSGAGKTNRTDKPFAIPLDSAWNFIGNPFHFAVPLNNMSLKSGKFFTLRYHDGTWRDPILRKRATLEPFEGYAVFNPSESSDTLFINPDLSTPISPLYKEFASTVEANISWSIRILAQCQEALDEDTRAAIASGASGSWDELDQPEPPVIGEYVSVYFPHPEWAAPVGNKLAKNYCTDVRPMTSDNGHRTSDGELWPFEVKTNIRDKVNLTFEGIDDVPLELEVWLVDDALKITQNLRENDRYAVAGSEQPKQLKLVVGKGDFVGEALAEAQAIPTTYELSQNFPNPFNPATTIRYGLPQAGRVTLTIYNLLGEEVARIINDAVQAAGYHAAIWDGRNHAGKVVASGVYIYRLQAGKFSLARKMVLLQ